MSLGLDIVGRDAVNQFLNNPSPHFDCVETVIELRGAQKAQAVGLPESLCRRLLPRDVHEIGIRGFGIYVLLQICQTFPENFLPAQDCVAQLHGLLKQPKLHAVVEQILEGLTQKSVFEASIPLPLLQSLRGLDLPIGQLRQEIEETKRTTLAQLKAFIGSCGLSICGATSHTVFIRTKQPPTGAVLAGFPLVFANNTPCVLELKSKVAQCERERQLVLRTMFLKWALRVGGAASHVSWIPFSSQVFVAPTTKAFLIGAGVDDAILGILRTFARVLWIHTDPASVTSLLLKKASICSPQRWQGNEFHIPPGTELVILSKITCIVHELNIGVSELLAKIQCGCLVTDTLLSPELAAATSPRSVFPVFASVPDHKFVYFHETRASVDLVKTHSIAETARFKGRHCLVISNLTDDIDEPNVSTWNPFKGLLSAALKRKTSDVVTEVLVDLHCSNADCSEQLFVQAMDGAFAFARTMSTFHIFWCCDHMRHFTLTLAAVLGWRPVYFTRHNCISASTTPTPILSSSRKRKLVNIFRTQERCDALIRTPHDLLATGDFALIASITLLRKILACARVDEPDFMCADGSTTYAFALSDAECADLFHWVRQFDMLNEDTCSTKPHIRCQPATMMKRIALAFGRICHRILNSKPTLYAFYRHEAIQ